MKRLQQTYLYATAVTILTLIVCASIGGCIQPIRAVDHDAESKTLIDELKAAVQPTVTVDMSATNERLDKLLAKLDEKPAAPANPLFGPDDSNPLPVDDGPAPAPFHREDTPHEPVPAPPADEAAATRGDPAGDGESPVVRAIREEGTRTRTAIAEIVAARQQQQPAVADYVEPDEPRSAEDLTGYTGCLVYCEEPEKAEIGESSCVPVNAFVNAVRKLPSAAGRQWQVSSVRNRHFWLRDVREYPGRPNAACPRFIFYRNGTAGEQVDGLPDDLRAFLRRHPGAGGVAETAAAPQRPLPAWAAEYGPTQPVQQRSVASGGDCSGPAPQPVDPWASATPQRASARGQWVYRCQNGQCRWEYQP